MKGSKRWYLTPCGLDCSCCTIRLRTREELDYWKGQGVDPDKIRCDGCRSDRTGHHWSPDCKILKCCVDERHLEFCAECPDLPCSILEEWAGDIQHHKQAVERLSEMKKAGIDEWLKRHIE